MIKADYIRQMTYEELLEMCDNAEEQIMLPSCKREYCGYSREDGTCEGVRKGGCKLAMKKWLNSPVKEGRPWYE